MFCIILFELYGTCGIHRAVNGRVQLTLTPVLLRVQLTANVMGTYAVHFSFYLLLPLPRTHCINPYYTLPSPIEISSLSLFDPSHGYTVLSFSRYKISCELFQNKLRLWYGNKIIFSEGYYQN